MIGTLFLSVSIIAGCSSNDKEKDNAKEVEQAETKVDTKETAVKEKEAEAPAKLTEEEQLKLDVSSFMRGKLGEMMKLYYSVDSPSEEEIEKGVHKLFKDENTANKFLSSAIHTSASEVKNIKYNEDSERIFINDIYPQDGEKFIDYVVVTESRLLQYADSEDVERDDKTLHFLIEQEGDSFLVRDVNIQRGHTVEGAASELSPIGEILVLESHLENYFKHVMALNSKSEGEAITSLAYSFRDNGKASDAIKKSSYKSYLGRDIKYIRSEITDLMTADTMSIEGNPFADTALFGEGVFTVQYEENGNIKNEDFNFNIELTQQNALNEEFQYLIEDLSVSKK